MANDQPAEQPTATNQPVPPPAPDAQERKDQKEYSLKPIQNQMLAGLQENYFSTLANFLSFLALEFWGYTVTPTTKFEVREGKVYIWEGPPPPAPQPGEQTAGQPAQPGPVNANGAKADEPSIA